MTVTATKRAQCEVRKPWPGHVVTVSGEHYVVHHRCMRKPGHGEIHRCRCGETWVE